MGDLVKAQPPKKSLALGFLLGLIPGLGLFYSAPLVTAAVATLFVGAVLTIVGWLAIIPIIGWLVGKLTFAALTFGSALLGLLYTNAYNKNGRRTQLSERVDPTRRLPL